MGQAAEVFHFLQASLFPKLPRQPTDMEAHDVQSHVVQVCCGTSKTAKNTALQLAAIRHDPRWSSAYGPLREKL